MNNTTFDFLMLKKDSLARASQIFPWVVVLICTLPLLLHLMGVDFSSHSIFVTKMLQYQGTDDTDYRLSGLFIHSLLEWSAFMTALCVAIFAFVHYRMLNDETMLVIGIVLLASGFLDAFHTLAASLSIEEVVDNHQLIPVTWIIDRTFSAIILTVCALFLLVPIKESGEKSLPLVLLICGAFVAFAYGLIYYCSVTGSFPNTLYPDSFIPRPFDLIPLGLFIFTGLFLLPRYYRQSPSFFSLSLLVSMIPQVILEGHMILGSSASFDNHSNIAHFLKIIAYLIPFIGMVMEYSFTHQKKTELLKKLTNTKAHAQAVLETAVNGIITINHFGIIKSVNPMAIRQFGYSSEEMNGQHIKMLMPESYQSYFDSYLSNHTDVREEKMLNFSWELVGLRKDGNEFPMEFKVVEIQGDELMFTGFVQDISERKQFEAQLIEREELFSTFVNSAPVLMWMSDADNKLVMFNDRLLDFFGADLQDEIVKPWEGLLIHEEFREFCQNTYLTKMAAREPIEQEYKMRDKTGRYFWFREIAVPRFHHGKFQGYISNLIDISDRKVVEEGWRDSMDNLLKSNEELEQFAYVASHDLQGPLRMVASYTQLLKRRYHGKLDADADEFIEYATDGAKHMQKLIQGLLEYSRVESLGKPLSLTSSDAVLQVAIANTSVALNEAGMQLTFDDMPRVVADKKQLLQVLQNLISNAIKYRDPEKSGKIHVGAKLDGNNWVFSVSDNGRGIKSEFFERIFIIFKHLGFENDNSGTGIGLSICKKIVERHGGRIWVESEFGEGSTFFFTLLCVEEIPSGESNITNEKQDDTLLIDETFAE